MTKWLQIAKRERGTKEIRGRRDNPRILEYFARSGHAWVKDDETAWCSAFINWVMAEAGVKGTGSLAARSWLHWGKKLHRGRQACVVIFKRGNSTWQGHVGLYVGETATHIKVLGGNQANAVNIRSYPKSRVLGYRWPSTMGNSRKVRAKIFSLLSSGSAVAAEAVPEAKDKLAEMDASWVPWALLALTVFAIGYAIWRQLKDDDERGEPHLEERDPMGQQDGE